MSKTRKERTLAQSERIAAVFDRHPGGVSKGMLCAEAELPEGSVSRLMSHLRTHAIDYGHVAYALPIGGQWIYGWADSLHQHYEEHKKRRANEARALRNSVETYTQSLTEHPDSLTIRRQLQTATARLDAVELEIEELTGQLRLIRRETAA